MRILEMRDGWIETSLGEIAEVIGGGTPSTAISEYWDGDIVWLTPTEITSQDGKIISDSIRKITDVGFKNSGAQMLKKDSVILTSRASVGFVALSGKDLCTNQGFQSLVPKQSVLAKFLMFWIQQNRSEFESRSAGSTFKEISKSNVKSIKLQLPPLPEQKRIVDLISSVDSYIESLQQQLNSAKKSRNAVLHELLTAGGDDWIERKLPEVVEVLDRFRKPVNSTEREERKGTIPYYGANGQTGWIDDFIFDEELVLLGEDAIDFADPNARKAYLIQGPSWVNNHAHVLRANKSIVNSYFLMESLNRVDYSQYVSFGTRSKLTQASMNGIKLLIPPMNIQEKFVDLLENFDEVIEATQRSIEDSKVWRSGLLSDLLRGEHEIPTSYDKVMGAA
jgi:type I restriction enzyme S subunit